jgi:hypothetical protein
VRRNTVSIETHAVQQAGLIRYSRGQITILNRDGLEDCACECYSVIRAETDKLLIEWRRTMTMSLDAAAQVMREAMREKVKQHSLWYLAQGGVMILAGILALVYPVVSSFAQSLPWAAS